MSFDQDKLLPPPAVYCSGECYRQCSPESCPGLTAQCTDRCVVVTCLDPHDDDDDDDDQEACGDIVCDDQSCTDPTDCHGIYDFVSPLFFSRSFFSFLPTHPFVFSLPLWV